MAISIETKPRESGKNLWKLRKEGRVPAVFYGPGVASTSISVSLLEFSKMFEQAGESTVVELKTKDGALDAMVHDIAHDPVTGTPTHIDFYLVSKDREIEVDVPIEFTGVAPAERVGGSVIKVLHEIRVKALPSKLPKEIIIDLSLLEHIDDHITIADLKLADGVKAVADAEDVIVSVTKQREEKEEEAPAAIDLSAIEVEKKGKKEEEGEGGEEAA